MTVRFVSNAATFVTGLTEADAYQTLGAAITAASASDTIKVSSTHTETAGAAISYTFPTTVGLKIVSVTFNGLGTGAAAAGAVINVGAASAVLTIGPGFVYCFGVTFAAGTNNNNACDLNIGATGTALPVGQVYESCTFSAPSASAGAFITIGPSNNANNDDTRIVFRSTVFSQGLARAIVIQSGIIEIDGGSLAGTGPTTVFAVTASTPAFLSITGFDFSGAGTTPAIVNVAGGTYARVTLRQCVMKSGFTPTTGTNPGPGATEVIIIDCDSGDNHYTYSKTNWSGTVTADSGKYAAGSSNGTDSFSFLMVSSANASFTWPLTTPDFAYWNAALSAVTPTVAVAHNAVGGGTAGVMLDSEMWVSILAKITSGSTKGTLDRSDRAADILATGADQTTDATTSWTGASIASHQSLNPTASITPAEVGPIVASVRLAKPSVSVYASPLILSGARKVFIGPNGTVHNEVADTSVTRSYASA